MPVRFKYSVKIGEQFVTIGPTIVQNRMKEDVKIQEYIGPVFGALFTVVTGGYVRDIWHVYLMNLMGKNRSQKFMSSMRDDEAEATIVMPSAGGMRNNNKPNLHFLQLTYAASVSVIV